MDGQGGGNGDQCADPDRISPPIPTGGSVKNARRRVNRIDADTVNGWVDEFLTFIPPDLIRSLTQKFRIRLASQAKGGPDIRGAWHSPDPNTPGDLPVLTLYLDGSLMASPGQAKRTMFHELTHWLEWAADAPGMDPAAGKRIKQWIDDIVAHVAERTSKDPTGGFYDPYCLREYEGKKGREVAPRHLELLSDPLVLKNELFQGMNGATPANTIETLKIIAKILSQ